MTAFYEGHFRHCEILAINYLFFEILNEIQYTTVFISNRLMIKISSYKPYIMPGRNILKRIIFYLFLKINQSRAYGPR